MRVNLLYFARLREQLGLAQETLALPDQITSVAALLDHLRVRGEPWHATLALTQAYRVAVNQEMAELATTLHEGDEIAIFPPVTGG